MKSHLSRRAGVGIAAALAASALSIVQAPAQAVTATTPVDAGATWLTNQIQSNGLLKSQYGIDYWTSADAALALYAIGGHTSQASGLVTALATNVNHYISNVDYGYADEYSAGSTAKAIVLAELAGTDPTTFGGVNLVTRLDGLVSTTAPTAGRIADTVDPADSFGGDYANTIGQAFAARALAEDGSTHAADALAYLLKQQCQAGYFRLYLTSDKTAADQTCQGGVATGASPADTDTTSFALLELSALANPDAATSRAIGKAEAWLISQQRADGSFGGGPSTPGSNSNSTGLAGWALGNLNDTVAAGKAAAWVRAHQAQNVAPCTDALSSQSGAIAYDNAGLITGRAAGIPSSAEYAWNLATAQALPVLQWAPTAGGTLKAAGSATYVQAKTRTNVTVSGLVPGAPSCVTLGTTHTSVAADLNGSAVASVLLPAGTANRSVSVTDGSTTVTTTLKVLDTRTFAVSVNTLRPRQGTSVLLRVAGLASGEQLTLTYAGRVIRHATATSTGTYAGWVPVGTSLGNKALVVTGQFGNRRGAVTLTVVR